MTTLPIKIRVAIIDDHAPVRDGLKWQIHNAPDIDLVGEGDSVADIERLLRDVRPDVLVSDIKLPLEGGGPLPNRPATIETANRLVDQYPTKILLLSTEIVESAMAAGLDVSKVRGYVLKGDAQAGDLVTAIRRVQRGQLAFSEAVQEYLFTHRLNEATEMLSSIELECLRVSAPDLDVNQDVLAERLTMAKQTFKNHLAAARRKLAVQSTGAAVMKALRLGLLDLKDLGKN
jgi:DNA-binding NarL/FixJ family response regulator